MSGNDRWRGSGGSAAGAPLARGGGAIVSRLPAPPNARADGLDPGAAGLARFVARQAEVCAPASGPAGAILLKARTRQARRRRTHRTLAGAALGVLAVAGFVAWTAVSRLPPTLSYTVDGASPPPGGYVRPSAGHQPELAFSDGTNIRVMPGGRARVLAVGRRGARVMLEDGRAHVHVAHRPGADWQVQAGTFVIHVHGTAFFVEWDSSRARLSVQMESGVVSVDGPRPGETVTLRAGQSLRTGSDGKRTIATAEPAVMAARRPGGPRGRRGVERQRADVAARGEAVDRYGPPCTGHRAATGALVRTSGGR